MLRCIIWPGLILSARYGQTRSHTRRHPNVQSKSVQFLRCDEDQSGERTISLPRKNGETSECGSSQYFRWIWPVESKPGAGMTSVSVRHIKAHEVLEEVATTHHPWYLPSKECPDTASSRDVREWFHT